MTRLSEPALRVDVISKGTSSAGEAKQSPGLSPLNTRAEIDNLRDGPAKDPVLETNRASTKACPLHWSPFPSFECYYNRHQSDPYHSFYRPAHAG